MSLTEKKCQACEGGVPALSETDEDKLAQQVSGWSVNRNGEHKIQKTYEFKDFVQAIKFVDRLAELAEDEGHHPDITINYNKVHIDLSTHAVGGLTENDFILAAKADEIEV